MQPSIKARALPFPPYLTGFPAKVCRLGLAFPVVPGTGLGTTSTHRLFLLMSRFSQGRDCREHTLSQSSQAGDPCPGQHQEEHFWKEAPSCLSASASFYFFFLTFYFVLGYNRLTNNVVIVSREQRRDSAINTHVSIGPQTPLPSRLPHNMEQNSLCYTVLVGYSF